MKRKAFLVVFVIGLLLLVLVAKLLTSENEKLREEGSNLNAGIHDIPIS